MKDMEKKTVNTYIHRQQDGTAAVIGTDPTAFPDTASAMRRLREYLKGGKGKCTGK